MKIEVIPPKPLREMDERELFSFRDEWQPLGNCWKGDSTVFFPKPGGVPEPAKTLCEGGELELPIEDGEDEARIIEIERCPVKNTCLVWAQITEQANGIWGGKRFDREKQPGRSRGRNYQKADHETG